MAHTAHYDRATPYGYYEPRHELRQAYLTAGGQARRRIAVAVSTLCSRQGIFVTDVYM